MKKEKEKSFKYRKRKVKLNKPIKVKNKKNKYSRYSFNPKSGRVVKVINSDPNVKVTIVDSISDMRVVGIGKEFKIYLGR